MAPPLFSIVIPTYNRARRAVAAVRSALWQTDPGFECLVVDDGSADDTRARLEPLSGPRLRLFFNAVNRGQHVCRNQAIREAKGEWIAFLDSDDLFLPRRLERVRAAIEARPDVGFWFTNAYVHRYGRIVGTLFDPARAIPEGRVPGYYAVGDERLPYVTSVVVVRREAFLKTGFFREDLKFLEDTELYARMLEGGLKVGALREPSVVRFLHEGNITQGHLIGYAEALEALESASTPPEAAARLKARFARQGAEYLLKALQPEAARAFLLREAGPAARSSPLYAKTFIPAPALRAAKALRRGWLMLRHHPAFASRELREVQRLIDPLLDA